MYLIVGLEDSCKPLNVQSEVREKFLTLLKRLMILLAEDSRIPRTIKITVRKLDRTNKISHRETRQTNINPSLFSTKNLESTTSLSEEAQNKLLVLVMQLFKKLVDVNKPYYITLLGLAFTKFQERAYGRSSIAYTLPKILLFSRLRVLKIPNMPLNLQLGVAHIGR